MSDGSRALDDGGAELAAKARVVQFDGQVHLTLWEGPFDVVGVATYLEAQLKGAVPVDLARGCARNVCLVTELGAGQKLRLRQAAQ